MLYSAKEHIEGDNITEQQQLKMAIQFSVLISVYKKEKAEYLIIFCFSLRMYSLYRIKGYISLRIFASVIFA